MKLIKKKNSIFKQLVLFTIVISIVPIIMITGFLFQKIEDLAVGNLVDSYEEILSQYTSNLEENIKQYKNSLTLIANNTIIQTTLTDSSKSSTPYTKGTLISAEVVKSLFMDQSSEIRNCMIYSNMKDYPVYGNRVSMIDEANKEGWSYNKKGLTENEFSYVTGEKGNTILSFVKKIERLDLVEYKMDNLGMVKLDVYVDRLFAPAQREDDKDSNFNIIVYGGKDNILYSTDKEYNNILNDFLNDQGVRYSKWQDMYKLGDYIISQQNLDEYGLHILFLFDNSELADKRLETQLFVLPLVLSLILIIVIGSYFFTNHFSTRVNTLVNKIKFAETGDLTITDPISGSDEIALLDHQFNHMLLKLDKLIQKNYIQQLEKKETQLRNLQLQINPHFLYNTLETISSIAAINHLFVVCDMCEKLGEIFRYSLGKNYGEFVTVAQELHHTQNYIFIQKVRHSTQFEVKYKVDKGLEDQKILRFILQPIVENTVLHGLGNLGRTVTLEIAIYEEENNLIVLVADDGVGMEGSRCEELNLYINQPESKEDKKKSIGIRNVNQRIKLTCGDSYGITIACRSTGGSSFKIKLPLIERGVLEDEI